MIKNKCKKGLAVLLALLLITSFITIPAIAEPVTIAVNVTSPTNKYDGETRSDCIYLYGNNQHYSWVEYEINVAEAGVYQLDAEVAVGANQTAQLQILVDDAEVEGIFDVAPYSEAWKKRSAMLHDSIPLSAGTRKIKIKQAELVSGILIYSMNLTKVGEIQKPDNSNAIAINVTSPTNKYDGETRSDCIYLYGNNQHYSWVEYEINVAEAGIYQLDAEVAVGANQTSQLQIIVDDVEVEGIFDIAPDSTAWKKRSAVLHDSIPLSAGTRKIKIKQAELVSGTLIYSMNLTKVGEIQNPEISKTISVNITSPTNKYDGTVNTNNFQLYGNNSYYSWVEYEIDVDEAGIYQLDANLAVGANLTAQLQILVDDVEIEGIFDVAPSSVSYEKRDAMLHNNIPLVTGKRKIKIKQAELVSTVQLFSLTLTKVGEIQGSNEPDIPEGPGDINTIDVDVLSPADKYDGEMRSDCVFLYGSNTNYSWVEYEIEVEKTALYQLDALIGVSANITTRFQILVDGEEVEGIFDIAPDSGSYTKRNVTLHDSIPLIKGTRTLRIKQAELVASSLLYGLILSESGEYEEPDEPGEPDIPDGPDEPNIAESVLIDVTKPIEKHDGIERSSDFFFYGGDAKNYSWGTFKVEIPEDGTYRPDIKLAAAANQAGGYRLEIDGVMLNDIFEFPADPGSYTLRSFSMAEISLTAGTHTIRVYQTVAEVSQTLNYFALTRTGAYKRTKSVTILGSKATSNTAESKSNQGDGYKEWSQIRGGNKMTFDVSMPTGMYDVTLLVSASKEYDGFAMVSVNGVTTQTEKAIPANSETDATAKDSTYYEVAVAEGVWLHTGDNTIEISGAKSNTNFFYLRGIVLKPAEKNWDVQTSFGDFAADGSIDVNIFAKNNGFTENIEMVLAIAFYDSEGELLELTEKPCSIANDAPVDTKYKFVSPANTAVAKAFVWNGTSIYDSQMMYYTEVIEKIKEGSN